MQLYGAVGLEQRGALGLEQRGALLGLAVGAAVLSAPVLVRMQGIL